MGGASSHPGFHILRKDGDRIPVAIWSSEVLKLDGQSLAIVEFRDISDEVQREHRLSSQNWALSAFSVAALALGRAQSTEGLLQSICDGITRESVYVLAWIGIAEEGADKKIRIKASAGSASGYMDGLQLGWAENDPAGQGPTAACIRTNSMQMIEDTEESPFFEPWRERARLFGMRSCVSVPLRIEGSWQGALNVYAARPNAFESAPVEVFERLAAQIVHGVQALEHKRLLHVERLHLEKTQRDLTDALSASVSAMVTAMEMRDPYTAGHESRVAEIAHAIGQEMGWDDRRLQAVRMAAMVHDIGKISIPAEILGKPGRLTAAEYALVKQHPDTGYAILKDIPFTWPIADIVRQHHEKLDGSGYPLGLRMSAILPESRVLAVADIVEAMGSNRPYRAGLGLDVVLREIEDQAGVLLDAEVVRVCAGLFRAKKIVLHNSTLR
jgi:putative nucleotidyltransferase with HDIG domain